MWKISARDRSATFVCFEIRFIRQMLDMKRCIRLSIEHYKGRDRKGNVEEWLDRSEERSQTLDAHLCVRNNDNVSDCGPFGANVPAMQNSVNIFGQPLIGQD